MFRHGTYILLLWLCAAVLACSEDPQVKFDRLSKQASEYIANEQYEEARITLLNAIDSKPDDVDSFIKLADVYLQLRQFSKTFDTYRHVLDLDPAQHQTRKQLIGFLLAAKQFELAESELRKLVEVQPDDVEVELLQASLLRGRRDLDAAETILLRLREENPQQAIVLANLADVASARGQRERSEKLLREALALDESNETLKLALANVMIGDRRLDQAESLIAEVLKEHPDHASLRMFYGEFLLQRGEPDRALPEFRAALKGEPLRHQARDRLYDLYLTRGKRDAALALTAELQDVDGGEAAHAYFRGRNTELAGDREAAYNLYLQAIGFLPNFAPAFRRAGLLELQLGREQEGLEHLSQAVAIDGSDIGARLALARHAMAEEDFSRTVEHLRHILQRYPHHVAANVMRADVALLEGNPDAAQSVYQTLISAFPERPVGYVKMGLLEEKRGNVEAAIAAYRNGLRFDEKVLLPGSRLVALLNKSQGTDAAIAELRSRVASSVTSKAVYRYLWALVLVSSDVSRVDEARQLLQQAIDEQPDFVEPITLLGRIEIGSGDYAGAEKRYQQLRQQRPDDLSARFVLAALNERKGDMQTAATMYREVLEKQARHPHAANNLAWLLATTLKGDLDEALRLAKLAKEGRPDSASVTDTLAWVYYQRGQHRAALSYIKEALDLTERSSGDRTAPSELLYHLGAIHLALGDQQSARRALKQSLSEQGGQLIDRAQVEGMLKQIEG